MTLKNPVLRRSTVRWLCLLGILGIAYASLVPFRLDPGRSFTGHLAWHPPLPHDAAVNVAIYVPIGLLARLMFRRRGSSAVGEWAAALLLAGGLAFGVEYLQTGLDRRVGSWTDVLSNLVGAALGAALAPPVQRILRNQHAWLYRRLHDRPFTAAAATALTALAVVALTPFDVRPTPAHVLGALSRAGQTPRFFWGQGGFDPSASLPPLALYDKLTAAGACGVAAFLLVLAARENGRRPGPATWYGLSRAASWIAMIELLQLFTVSHVADPRDLLAGWGSVLLGGLLAGRVLFDRDGRLPRPGTVLRRLLILAAAALPLRAFLELWSQVPSGPRPATWWMPLAVSFHRPWDAVLSSTVNWAIHAGLIAGVVVLWYRSLRRRPPAAAVWLAPAAWAAAHGFLTWWAGGTVDTILPVVALLAGGAALRMDRAFFKSGRMSAASHRSA